MWLRWFAFPVLALAGVGVLGLALAGFVILLAYPNLPSIEALTEYQPKIPLRVYTADGVLIGEFGEERRSVVSIEEVPALMKQAILAAEDERFYQHTGDRKSTRLNSSHSQISYAVFCLKKKKEPGIISDRHEIVSLRISGIRLSLSMMCVASYLS